MIVLGLDTSLKRCSAAVLVDGQVRARLIEERIEGHAERLPLMAREALRQARLRVADLDRVGVVAGPGGFAGVRVGIAFARALAIGTRLAVIGVGSLEALAASVAGRLAAAVVDARRGEVYAALFAGDGATLEPPFAATPDVARTRLIAAGGAGAALVGDACALIDPEGTTFARTDFGGIDPVCVARLAAARLPAPRPPAPIYLRAPDARPGAPSPFAALFTADPQT